MLYGNYTEIGRRDRDPVSAKIPFPVQGHTSRRDFTNKEHIPEEQGVVAPYQASQPLGPATERQASKTSVSENQQDLHPEDSWDYRTEDSILNELANKRIHPGTQSKSNRLKST